MSPRLSWHCVAFLLVVGLHGASARAAPVLLISVDGLLPEAYLDPDRLGLRVPNLRELKRQGAWAQGAKSVMPSITFPAHTTIITGVSPSRHGVLSNEVFDPDGTVGGGWNWYASDVKVPTLFDRVRAHGLTSAAVTWPATAGAPIDLNLPDMYPVANLREAKNLLSLARTGASASVLDEVLPPPHSLIRLRDETRVKVALRFLAERPHFMAVHFLELDDAQHAHGPRSPQALAMIERIDTHIGALINELRAQRRWDDTTLVLVSDHGFLPMEREVRIATLLRAVGLLEVDTHGKLSSWRAFCWPQGGSAGLYLHPQATAEDRRKLDQVIALLKSNSAYGVGRVLKGPKGAALGGLPGAYAIVDALPGFSFGRGLDAGPLVTAKRGGTHGHVPDRDQSRAAFMIRGPGIRASKNLGLVRLLDVAPTLARILGVQLGRVEGRVLAEAFGPSRPTMPPARR